MILQLLEDGKPRTCTSVSKGTGINKVSVYPAMLRYWKDGLLLRTKESIKVYNRIFRGRAGFRSNTRCFYLYVIRPEDVSTLRIDKHEYVAYNKAYMDKRGPREGSKAQLISNFLEEHDDKAWFSKEIVEALKDHNIHPSDIMTNVRRYQKKGLIHVRGYRTVEKQTPFEEGYLLTWIDQVKPRKQALEKAIQRTDERLTGKISGHSTLQRVQTIFDQIFTASRSNEIIDFDFLWNAMGCTKDRAEYAVKRALQLYLDLKVIKVFDRYRQYYHVCMNPDHLQAAIEMRKNYYRKTKGRDNRIGHNWEGCTGWFIDTFTKGADFWTQDHRTPGMDPRRITIHLLKRVGDRQNKAEVDRVWEISPGPLLSPNIFVLECKFGLVRQKDIDDFFNVLKWSKEFGTSTKDGRMIKQGVKGVFAGSAFKKEDVRLNKDDIVSLAQYANRLNLDFIKAADLNQRLHEHGCTDTITVQMICKRVKNENEVRKTLDALWKNPKKGDEILKKLALKNKSIYEFEKMLEETGKRQSSITKMTS